MLSLFWFSSCKKVEWGNGVKVVVTTSFLKDLVQQIGKDKVSVISLMGAGIDPHMYKASEGDVQKITTAEIILYSGLHLEGKMVDIFEKMKKSGYQSYAVSDGLSPEDIINSADFSGSHDPHIWFSVENWKKCTLYVAKILSEKNPANAAFYKANAEEYIEKLNQLEIELKNEISKIPKEKRVLITAHDAFSYFGRDFNFEVKGIQGISTVSEAGAKDMIALSHFIVEHKIPSIFVESSMSDKTIRALQRSVENKGFKVDLGGTLYSDALGSPNSGADTYIGMYKANVETIVKALNK